jgi:hypothetical protein
MKPTVKKIKAMRGRIVGYSAHIGEVKAEGATPTEASEACDRAVALALARLDRGVEIGSWRGHTYIVFPTVEAWGYWIDTSSVRSYVGVSEREEAQDAALHHLAQNLWGPEVNDESFLVGLPLSVASELARWIRFQRSYAALRAEGKSDIEAHRLAAG